MKTEILIRPDSMRAMTDAARKLNKAGKPVYVTALLNNYYGGNHASSTQRRRLLAAELDRLGIPRARRVDKPAIFEQVTLKGTQYGLGITTTQNMLEDSIPGTLGGLSQDDSEHVDVDFEIDYDARRDDLDSTLAVLADQGNERARNLLLRRLGAR